MGSTGRWRWCAAAIVAAGASLGVAGVAGASNRQITGVGGNTSYTLMHNLFKTSINDLSPGGSTANQVVASTTNYCAGGRTYSAATSSAPNYAGGPVPNGSTAGKTTLQAQQTLTGVTVDKKGCIDFSRSSSPPKPGTGTPGSTTGNGASFDYYAYALDGVTVLLGGDAGGTKSSPAAINLQQLKAIYSCTEKYIDGSTPYTTGAAGVFVPTWGDTGIVASTTTYAGTVINRFYPQPTSGTQSVYKDILGFTPAATATTATGKKDKCATATDYTTAHTRGVAVQKFTFETHVTTPTSHTVTTTVTNEENSEEGMIYANSLTPSTPYYRNINNDIFVYSVGKYVSEYNTVTNFNKTHTDSEARAVPAAHGGGVNAIGNFVRTQTAATGRVLRMAAIEDTLTHSVKNLFANYLPTTASPHPTGLYSINPNTIKETDEWYHQIPGATTGATTSTAAFPGVRYLYNVADIALPTYTGVKNLLGFDNRTTGAKSRLCAGDLSSVITASGFLPLNKGSSAPARSDNAAATCREFPGHYYPGKATATTYKTFVYATATWTATTS